MKKRLERIERALRPGTGGQIIVVFCLPDGRVEVDGETLTEAEWQARQREHGGDVIELDLRKLTVR